MWARSTSFGHVLVVDPLQAVAGDFVPLLHQRLCEFGVARERTRDGEHRERQPALGERAHNAPHTHARAVLVDALHAHVARGVAFGVEHFREELLRARVAVQHAVFTAFLVVEHELHGDARAPGHCACGGLGP